MGTVSHDVPGEVIIKSFKWYEVFNAPDESEDSEIWMDIHVHMYQRILEKNAQKNNFKYSKVVNCIQCIID